MRRMDLKTYFFRLDKEARQSFAVAVESSVGHLNNVAYGIRKCATDLAVLIEEKSGGAVSRQELRPDDYWRHWPDLPVPAEHVATHG